MPGNSAIWVGTAKKKFEKCADFIFLCGACVAVGVVLLTYVREQAHSGQSLRSFRDVHGDTFAEGSEASRTVAEGNPERPEANSDPVRGKRVQLLDCTMFGSFSDDTLTKYNEMVRRKKEEKPAWMDNMGIGSFNNDFKKTGESMMKEDYYSEHDYAECLRVGQ